MATSCSSTWVPGKRSLSAILIGSAVLPAVSDTLPGPVPPLQRGLGQPQTSSDEGAPVMPTFCLRLLSRVSQTELARAVGDGECVGWAFLDRCHLLCCEMSAGLHEVLIVLTRGALQRRPINS
ncbi:hypothetical protein ROHU_034510 [Labeo rohita]|uniref:Uncharacterized protein n=1 Tax=Labeo rohita TaxID=84645 RepID=A0A498LBM7_LABRO|nr:hypothetical protein ROHU_034510 [Labeo rohita]